MTFFRFSCSKSGGVFTSPTRLEHMFVSGQPNY